MAQLALGAPRRPIGSYANLCTAALVARRPIGVYASLGVEVCPTKTTTRGKERRRANLRVTN